jgi:iron complex outermembrane recepter protein
VLLLRPFSHFRFRNILVKIPSYLYASACFLAVFATTPAYSEEASDDNGAIIVIGQRETPIEIEPRGLTVSLGKEQFKAVNAFNVEDLMKYAPNFFVRKRYSGDSNGVPGFRGTHSTQSARTLVMVDGFVVSNFLGNSFGFAPKWGVVGPGEVKQFDIVYGPYSSRYAGNSIGGIVNITTSDPQETEAFANAQRFVQPYNQFSTKKDNYGYSGEAGVAWKQKDGPFSARLTGRYFRNDGQPMVWYGLTPVTGAPGTAVTGAVVDPKQLQAVAAGMGISGSPGTMTNPIFAAQARAQITQRQAKLKIGYDDGAIKAQGLLAFWHNEDLQDDPDCYLRDVNDNKVCEGRVTTLGRTFVASGANWSHTVRDEFLAGLKITAPLGADWNARVALSTYQVAKSAGFTSNSYAAGQNNGAGTLADQGPTGWYTGDATIENKTDSNEFAIGFTANRYQTELIRYNLTNWRSAAGRTFVTQVFGKTRTLSAWAENCFLIGDGSITLGLRYDNWRAFDGGLGRIGTAGPQLGQPVFNRYAARQKDAISPTLSGQVRLVGGTDVQLSLAAATRFPTVGELFQGSLNGDGTFNNNSFDPNLKPERSRNLNLLVSHDFDVVKLTGSYFFQDVRNTIFSFTGFNQNGITTSSFKNIDRTRQSGLELVAEARDWPIPGMTIEANAAYINSKTIRSDAARAAEGVQFPRIPKWRINANMRYDFSSRVNGAIGLRYASRPNTDLFGLQRGDTFGYTSELFALDAKLNWDLNDHFRLSVGADNITNNKAWVFHPYPQRTFLIEAGVKL